MSELFRSENIIFLAPMLVGVMLFLVLASIGGHGGHGETDVHADLHSDINIDADHDVSVDHDHDISSDGHDSPDEDENFFAVILGFFGVGKIPLNAVILSLTIIWGVTGYVTNLIVGYNLVVVSVVIAAFLAVLGTKSLAGGLSRLIPNVETYSQTGLHLWGTEAKVRFPVREKSGTICLTDRYNNYLELECRLSPDQAEIPNGTLVTVDDYDEVSGTYRVTVNDQRVEVPEI